MLLGVWVNPPQGAQTSLSSIARYEPYYEEASERGCGLGTSVAGVTSELRRNGTAKWANCGRFMGGEVHCVPYNATGVNCNPSIAHANVCLLLGMAVRLTESGAVTCTSQAMSGCLTIVLGGGHAH